MLLIGANNLTIIWLSKRLESNVQVLCWFQLISAELPPPIVYLGISRLHDSCLWLSALYTFSPNCTLVTFSGIRSRMYGLKMEVYRSITFDFSNIVWGFWLVERKYPTTPKGSQIIRDNWLKYFFFKVHYIEPCSQNLCVVMLSFIFHFWTDIEENFVQIWMKHVGSGLKSFDSDFAKVPSLPTSAGQRFIGIRYVCHAWQVWNPVTCPGWPESEFCSNRIGVSEVEKLSYLYSWFVLV